MKKKKTTLTLPSELHDRLITLGEEIHGLTVSNKLDEAERLCQSGLELIPMPREDYIETVWYYSGLGEIYFLREQYSLSRDYYERARLILEKEDDSDPYILLRLGETALETGDGANALRYLLGAYQAEGEEIFDSHDKKYYDFLKKHV